MSTEPTSDSTVVAGRSRGRWRRYSRCLRGKSSAADPTISGGRIPTHLVVMVNGIVGSARDWKYAAKQFKKRYPQDVFVHCSACNYGKLTFDGVDVMGKRLAEEVISIVRQKPELQKISFVGHSLGGLIARYAIAILYENEAVNDSSEDTVDGKSEVDFVREKFKCKIAGLEPMNFITFATPHLGSRSHKQIPILRFNALEKMAYHSDWIFGRTGKQLLLKDNADGKLPLLLQMVNDCPDLKFMSALLSFKRHVAYSNVAFDFIVGRRTSSIRRQHELPKSQNFVKNTKYPHIVCVEEPKPVTLQNKDFSTNTTARIDNTSEMEEMMINGLNRVPWVRVDVSFKKSIQKIFAHTTIQVKTYFLNSHGADVIFHMIDNFLL